MKTQTYITKMPQSSGNLVAYKVSGKVELDSLKRFYEELQEDIQKYGKLKLLLSLEEISIPEPTLILNDLPYNYLNDFSAIAVIGNEEWYEVTTRISNQSNLTIKVRHFKSGQEKEALDWLKDY